MRFRFFRIALLLCIIGARGVHADEGEPVGRDACLEDKPCREHYARARQHFKDKRYAEALDAYKQAHAQRQVPWLLVNIGRSYYRLGQAREALDYYQRFGQSYTGTDAELQSRVRRYVVEATELLNSRPAEVAPPASAPATEPPAPVAEPPEPPPAPLIPEVTVIAPAAAPAPVPRVSDAVARPAARSSTSARPIYKRAWFWALTAGVAVAAVVAGTVGAVVGRQESASTGPEPVELPPDVMRFRPSF